MVSNIIVMRNTMLKINIEINEPATGSPNNGKITAVKIIR